MKAHFQQSSIMVASTQPALQPRLARIDLYPFKSLDGATVRTATVLPSGALQHDRAFALVDSSGKFVNGKRDASIHRVRSQFSENFTEITVWIEGSAGRDRFPLSVETDSLEAWFSNYFSKPVTLQQNRDLGFPDDTDSPGPTVISTATLQAVANWYGLKLAEVRQRFRTNLEIDNVPAFWEDHLFSPSGEPVAFRIGEVTFHGINPCQRCIVPTRNTQTGQATADFQKQFVQKRAATLPETVARSRFNHFYRLAINTQLAPQSAVTPLKVGDKITFD